MKHITSIFILITSLLHIVFFKIESIDFMKLETLQRFSLTAEKAEVVKVWAYNQGFYNLFIAFGLLYGIYLLYRDDLNKAKPLLSTLLLIIVGAGIVLATSADGKIIAASIQAIPALIAFILLNLYSKTKNK